MLPTTPTAAKARPRDSIGYQSARREPAGTWLMSAVMVPATRGVVKLTVLVAPAWVWLRERLSGRRRKRAEDAVA